MKIGEALGTFLVVRHNGRRQSGIESESLPSGFGSELLYSISQRPAASYNVRAETQLALRVSPVPQEKTGTMETSNTALDERSRHRHRQNRNRKKLKRLLKQLLVSTVSIGIVVIAVLFWRFLVAN
jgi:hypothetical protein